MEEDVCQSNIPLQPELCNKTQCITDLDTQKLQCSKCKRKVHYKCTLLPPYQIHRYATFGMNYSTFMCVNCVEIPDSSKNYDCMEQNFFQEKYEKEVKQSKDLRDIIRTLNEKVQNIEKNLMKLE